jgi:hypothetical protein
MEMHHLTTAIMLTAAYRQGLEGGHWTVRLPLVAEPSPQPLQRSGPGSAKALPMLGRG